MIDLPAAYEALQKANAERVATLSAPAPKTPQEQAEYDVAVAVSDMRVKDRRVAYENAVQDEARRRFQMEQRGRR